MRRRKRQICALLAAAVLLTALAACQEQPGKTEAAALPTPMETPEPAEPSVIPVPPPQAVPSPQATAAPAAPSPPEGPADSPEESSPPPEPERRGNLVIQDGLACLTDGSGGVISHEAGLYEWDGYTYYFREDGTVAADEIVSIAGSDYRFDEQGRWMSPLRAAVEATETAKKTDQIVLAVDHELTFWEKAEDGSWQRRMETYCGYGKNGLVLAEERVIGSKTTPVGAFPLTLAFGTGEDPGTGMVYRQITPNSYWSEVEDESFNNWVESETPVPGEHLIDYYQYKYAVNIGFNLEDIVYSRGSAIFLHCKSADHWYTAGCVSLSEEDMLALLRMLRDGAYMIIVPDAESIGDY